MDNKKKGIGIFIAAILVISVFAAMPVVADGREWKGTVQPQQVQPMHYPGAVIYSNWATITPTIDGAFGPDEWSDATVVDLLAADPANELEAYAYFKNDANYLYIGIDVPDDTTEDLLDASTISFDTGHDAIYTHGHDDIFCMENGTAYHLVWNDTIGFYDFCCDPFDPTLPLHSGLAGSWGLGPSPNSGINHRIYEYRIPLALILASPGDTIGFGMDGEWWMGIYDDATDLGDQWPFLRWYPISIDEYGDLVLATVINSNCAIIEPTIDGVFGVGEYADATVIDILAADPSNPFPAYGYFKNDGTSLYVCLDASGDTTNDIGDLSVMSFDTGHDAMYTDGGEDNFAMVGDGSTWHFVWNSTSGGYDVCCEPFDPTLPDHAGLAGAVGFGTSPNSGINHRIYEYRIPLALIDAAPGDTLGFALDGEIHYGIYDATIGDGDQWPFYRGEPIGLDEYGDLILCKPMPVPTLTPIGLIALVGLLSVIAAMSISTSIRKKRR